MKGVKGTTGTNAFGLPEMAKKSNRGVARGGKPVLSTGEDSQQNPEIMAAQQAAMQNYERAENF